MEAPQIAFVVSSVLAFYLVFIFGPFVSAFATDLLVDWSIKQMDRAEVATVAGDVKALCRYSVDIVTVIVEAVATMVSLVLVAALSNDDNISRSSLGLSVFYLLLVVSMLLGFIPRVLRPGHYAAEKRGLRKLFPPGTPLWMSLFGLLTVVLNVAMASTLAF